MVDLYILLLDEVRADAESVPHGRDGFYFKAAKKHDLFDVSKAVMKALVELDRGMSPEPTTFTKEIDEYFDGMSNEFFPAREDPHNHVLFIIKSVRSSARLSWDQTPVAFSTALAHSIKNPRIPHKIFSLPSCRRWKRRSRRGGIN